MAEASKSERDVPKDISFDTIIVDLAFHPSKNVIASGEIDGDVTIHSYSLTEDSHLLMTLPHHKKACRGLRFSPDGDQLFTISKDKSLQSIDMQQGRVLKCIKKAHSAALYSLLVIDENMIATGDDDGTLKVWDMRQEKAVMDLKENEEFISDMIIDDKKRVLVETSGDGTVTAFDIRKHKMKLQSELFDSELLSLAPIKNSSKLVCGTGDGMLNIFNWGEWGNISDRFPGHPMSIDCMVAINDDIVCTGSMDGIVRAVNLLPNRFLGVVGEHDEFPVENLSLSHCRKYLASCSHDQKVKFWNVENIADESEEIDIKKKAKKTNKPKVLKTSSAKNNDFFADLAEDTKTNDKEEEESEDSEDDDEEESEDGGDGDNNAEITDSDSDDET